MDKMDIREAIQVTKRRISHLDRRLVSMRGSETALEYDAKEKEALERILSEMPMALPAPPEEITGD